MTDLEKDTVKNMTLVWQMEEMLRDVVPESTPEAIPVQQYNEILTTIRTWRIRLNDSVVIKKKRSDSGKERT